MLRVLRLSSLRQNLLALVARVLRGWLNAVSAQLEPGAKRQPERQPSDFDETGKPRPPDHWVDLVRQGAPQLLDSESSDSSESALVFDWRSDAATDEPQRQSSHQPSPVSTPRPLKLHPARNERVAVPTHKTALRRPLRLEQVAAEPMGDAPDVGEVTTQPSGQDAAMSPDFVRTTMRPVETTLPIYDTSVSAALRPPTVDTSVPFGDLDAERQTASVVETSVPFAPPVTPAFTSVSTVEPTRPARRFRLPALKLPIRRRNRQAPTAPPDSPTRAGSRRDDVPLVRRAVEPVSDDLTAVREARSSLPHAPVVPTIRTGTGARVSPHHTRTSAGAPPQIVLRPTRVQPPLSLTDVTADRWAALPDPPADEPRHPELERRERLKREQEGRAWSE